MKRILSIIIIIILSTILGLAYGTSTNLSLRLLEATDDVRPFREDFNYNFELVDDIFDDVSQTELDYLDGVTSAIQTQLDTKIETTLTEEEVEDYAGGMWTGNTETFITVTYQDGDGTIDIVLPILDEDNMSTNSATHLATQQSIKAYADSLHALQYLKTQIDALSELEAIWSKDVTDSNELASALADYYLKTAIDELSEVEAIYNKDIIDSTELEAKNYINSTDAGGELTVFSSVYSIDDTFEAGLRNGVYSGITVTDSAELTIHWTEGVAYVNGSIFVVNADTDETIANNDTTYLYILKDNATMQESTTEPTIGLVGEFALVCILYTYDNDIHEKFDYPLMTGNLRYEIWKFLDDITPTATVGGCNTAIDTNGSLANDFTIATGTYYIDVFDLNTIGSILYSSTSGHNANNLTAFFHESSSWVDSPENGVNFSYWDDGADKDTTAANKWYTAWIFVEDGDEIVYVYPQTEHANEAAALAESAVYPPYHQGVILPSAKFIFRHGVSAFGTTAYFIDIRPFFGYSDGGPTTQMIYQTVTGDSGSTTATASDDSLAIVGGGIAQTVVTADTVTITATEVDSIVGAITGIVKADGGSNITGIPIGTAGYALTTDSAETGYDWTLLMEELADDPAPTLGAELNAGAHSIGFTLQQFTATDGTTTIDWTLGNKFEFTFDDENQTFTFTPPTNAQNMMLWLIQDSTAGRTITWPVTCRWPLGVEGVLSTDSGEIDVVGIAWNGTYYDCVISNAFAVPAP